MSETDERYYSGFEGEPEIIFTLSAKGTAYKSIVFWEGYFDDMLRKAEPAEEGWTGIAYYYHVGMFENAHWLENQPWHIDDPVLVVHQLQELAQHQFKWPETRDVLMLLIDLIQHAIAMHEEILVYCD